VKQKLRYEQVFTKRNVRDPIDWKTIEKIRNEGWELLDIFGSLSEAVRNPTIAPIYAIFSKDEKVSTSVDGTEVKRLKGEIQTLKMQLGRFKNKDK